MTLRRTGDGGSVTAELAVGMVAVGVVLAALLSVVAVGVAQIMVGDAAAAGARLAARGEAEAVVRAQAGRMAGGGATVTVDPGGGVTSVTVTRSVALLLPGRPTVRVASRAVAVTELVEPTVAGRSPVEPLPVHAATAGAVPAR